MQCQRILLAAAMVAATGFGISTALADQDTAGGTGSASVDLNFQVTIPGVLRFRVGTGSSGSVDTIAFDPSASEYADGATVDGTGGDLGSGQVTVEVFTNRGEVTITEDNDGGGNGLQGGSTGTFISYQHIETGSDDTNLPAPTLSDAGGNTSIVPVTSGNFVDRSAVWTYQLNTTDLEAEPDTYTGTVTYTASAP